MKKSQLKVLALGSCQYVLAHAKWRLGRGRRPSMSYKGELNPRKALALAEHDVNIVEVRKATDKKWNIVRWNTHGNIEKLAELHLDYQDQIDKVVMMNDDEKIQRRVKELALSHAIQFVKHRSPILSCLLAIVPDRPLEEVTSDNLMDFNKIPEEITSFDDESLNKYLSEFAKVVESGFESLTEMFEHLFAEIKEAHNVNLAIIDGKPSWNEDLIEVTFCVKSDDKFRVWNNSDDPNGEYYNQNTALHIIPAYHPAVKGYHEVGLLNGDTDAYIGNSDNGISSVFSPVESRIKDGFGSSWSYINHPFYAEGSTLGIQLSETLCLSRAGYKLLFELLCAALNKGNSYLAVSGGFRSPYTHPQNMMARRKIADKNLFSSGRREARGSEDDCVWEYQTLKKENQLEESFIPNWFFREKWLDIYADQNPEFLSD
jgi:hypothetical protein